MNFDNNSVWSILKKIISDNLDMTKIYLLGKNIFLFLLLFWTTSVFFPIEQYYRFLFLHTEKYFIINNINNALHCIFYILVTLYLLIFLFFLLYGLWNFFNVFTTNDDLSKREKLSKIKNAQLQCIYIFEFPIITWIMNISWCLYFIDSNFTSETVKIFTSSKPILIFFLIGTIKALICTLLLVFEKIFFLWNKIPSSDDS